MPIITLENITKIYTADVEALDNISMSINKGDFVFVVGPSGSGKSTFLKLLLKEIEPTRGKIIVLGKDITNIKGRSVSKYRRGLGVVFQDFRLLNDRTVFENVALAQRVIGVSNWSIKKNVMSVLYSVGIAEKANAYPKELSGGEQQRVALARALVNKPRILLADEPTGNLDPQNAWSIMELLNDVNMMGTTVIVVTHNTEVVDEMQKRVITMKDGKILHDESKGGYLYEEY